MNDCSLKLCFFTTVSLWTV